MTKRDVLRVCRFHVPKGPAYRLTMWDTHQTDARGTTRIGYELVEYRDETQLTLSAPGPDGVCTPGQRVKRVRTVLFAAEDFYASPMHADDSDATVASLMTFLTLSYGDTDEEYFARYTDVQRDFAACDAEALSEAVAVRFGVES